MKTALVLGGGGCLWSDVREAMALGRFDVVVACNDAGTVWPGRLDAWVSLHPEKMGMWRARREKAGHPAPGRVFAATEARPDRVPVNVDETTDYLFPGQLASGSSGLFAAKVALIDLGADRAVLCGIPMMVKGGHFFDPTHWLGANSHRQGWLEAMPQITGRVRSMSGWTADQLGRPDKEWLGV